MERNGASLKAVTLFAGRELMDFKDCQRTVLRTKDMGV